MGTGDGDEGPALQGERKKTMAAGVEKEGGDLMKRAKR